MPAQDDFLDNFLLPAFPGQVSLVGKYADPALGFAENGPLRVFFPDFHWMSASCLTRYTGGYQFNGNRKLPDGTPLFATFLDVLERFTAAAGNVLEAYQLGDRYDLWRELTAEDEGNVMAAYSRIRNDPGVSGLAPRVDALGAKYIRGNHDNWLGKIEAQIPDPAFPDLESTDGKIFLTHGHRYDTVEKLLPDEVKMGGVWLCPKVKPGKHDIGPFSRSNMNGIKKFLAIRNKIGPHQGLYPTVRPDGAIPLAGSGDIAAIEQTRTTFLDLTQFWHGTDDRNDFEHISYRTFGDQILKFEQNHGNDHCLHVIGHTHHARLLVDRLPDGNPLVIMDTGGWIEDCTIRLPKGQAYRAPSAQFGVQCENEVRLYQLGGVIS